WVCIVKELALDEIMKRLQHSIKEHRIPETREGHQHISALKMQQDDEDRKNECVIKGLEKRINKLEVVSEKIKLCAEDIPEELKISFTFMPLFYFSLPYFLIPLPFVIFHGNTAEG
ncbi:hypothetical protein ACJX0J_024914, partial [Zea mays]